MGKMYDEEKELADYVWRNCQKYIPSVELTAYFAAYGKPLSQEITPEIRIVLKDGVDALRQRVSHSIAERPDVVIKRCHICKKIMRTPEARICLWCD